MLKNIQLQKDILDSSKKNKLQKVKSIKDIIFNIFLFFTGLFLLGHGT